MLSPSAVILIRHGQSEHHVRGLTGGWTDTPLTERGHRQARLAANRLLNELAGTPVTVLSSDLVRASQTAEHIANAFGTTVRLDQRLREHNNGASAGMTVAEARARWPEARDMRMSTRMVPGAETGSEFYARARSLIQDLSAADGGVPILVTHGGTIRMLCAAWLRLSDDALDYAHFASHPTGITVLVSWGDGLERMVERTNDTSHLAGSDGWLSLRDALR